MGALVLLQFGLQSLVRTHLLAGDLAAAAQAIEEVRAIAEATGTSPVAYTDMTLAAWRGQEALTAELIERQVGEASARGIGRVTHFATYAASVLHNGLGRYDAALDAARRAFEHDHLGYTPFVVPELAEAASRSGETRSSRPRCSGSPSAPPPRPATGRSGSRRACARSRARATRPSGSTATRSSAWPAPAPALELARARLLYGEWLRREGRRVDAREQLRVAREALLAMGADGFAERARHELLATGEKVRKRRDDTRDELTPQEQHIARLARDGLTNPEIGAELFLSPRTVEWHMKKVFTKLGISSRRALRDALPRQREPAPAARRACLGHEHRLSRRCAARPLS